MPHIVVSPLSRLAESATRFGARDMITLINIGTSVLRPVEIVEERHLFLGFNDIVEPMEGMTHPVADHVSDLIAFGRRWDREAPLLIHCYAGISRSTAGAYITALALNPEIDEVQLAQVLRRNAPSATPNSRLVALADDMLGRKGRMVDAIKAIGRGEEAFEGTPFILPIVV
ncbi:tyrosine phosphatase family protein [Phyllobacterium zundukense]|uniref:Tyrosine protein phosphatase n=1 Tax=Phyllobacterium zundukense TaxID=1867719 RepID=A0A2N9W3K8_9HYPH|nr:tyrosine phosphatase family protein [Phyllobacterium zundukense]ATU92195.1 tyrosine protein phosphatase [Phyllobacterium zundukense]PIO46326.1 tyrosine protein phosphatase [Phyllobacterium zundukense]